MLYLISFRGMQYYCDRFRIAFRRNYDTRDTRFGGKRIKIGDSAQEKTR